MTRQEYEAQARFQDEYCLKMTQTLHRLFPKTWRQIIDNAVKENLEERKRLQDAGIIPKQREITWDTMPPKYIWQYFPAGSIEYLRELLEMLYAGELRHHCKTTQSKYHVIHRWMSQFNFRCQGTGTNRITYYHTLDPTIVLKLAPREEGGREANLREMFTQQSLKPYCTKVYDVLPDGLLQIAERVQVMTLADFEYYEDMFLWIVLSLHKAGYIMEDVGKKFFKNWGIRPNFGAVLLDFPDLYEYDPAKMICHRPNLRTGTICGGEIFYDPDTKYSQIVCKNCKARYLARYLAKDSDQIKREDDNGIIRAEKTDPTYSPRFTVTQGDKVIYSNMKEIVNN